MPKINVLDSYIYNRISAGEVVERPASVVKELVENSLDAKATSITVEIIDGGTTSIKVSDNGVGIEKADLKNAVLPHATSKISCVEDLDNIFTLGFRGEALASIAAVSKLKIISKQNSDEFGAKIEVNGGTIQEITDFPANNGTEITVDSLFFNTPARQKFLKTPKSEEGEITSLMTKFILGNSEVSFKYIANGKVVYQSFGDGLTEAMINVYGAKIIDDCFYIDTIKNGISIKGYLGKHYFTKQNRTYQTLFLNNRYIVNSTVTSAITNAYSTYLMKRQYPFYVLNLSMPHSVVDVNVHPNKLDVRFSNNQIVYGAVYSVISKVLDGTSDALNIVKEDTEFIPIPKTENYEINTNKTQTDYVKHNPELKPYVSTDFIKPEPLSLHDHTHKDEKIFEENKRYIEELDKQKALAKTFPTKQQEVTTVTAQEEIKIEKTFNIIGQALNTFLILDDGIDLFLIDQHAAHERLIFDKLIEKSLTKTLTMQPLLIPYILEVNSEESLFIDEKLSYFVDLGIEIEKFGFNSYKIDAISTEISQINLQSFFNDLLSDLNALKNNDIPNIIRDKIAQKACKSAIKAGDKLTESEVQHLINLLKGNLGLKCPHGRPVCIKISRTEIDKWFKRIV